MRRFFYSIRYLVVLLGILFWPNDLHATPVHAFTSIPVAKGEFIYQSQFIYSRQNAGTPAGDLHANSFIFPQIFLYGPTSRATIITVVPFVDFDFNAPAALAPFGIESFTTFGVADIPFFFRYTFFHKDWIHQYIDLSILTGIEVPSGDNPFTSNSIDFPLGGIVTWQSTGNEIDADVSYKINTEGGGIEHGDQVIYDIAYSRRLLPWQLPEQGVSNQFNLVVELNGIYSKMDHNNPGGDDNTGGNTLLISPSLQYIFGPANEGKPFSVSAGVQLPIVQDLNGTQLKTKFNTIFVFGWRPGPF
jgi:hypothetical protein